MEPPRRRPPLHLEFGGPDDTWTDPDRRHEGHLRTAVLLAAAIAFIAAWSVLLSPSLFILAVMLVPAWLLAVALAWHTRSRPVPDYRDGRKSRRS